MDHSMTTLEFDKILGMLGAHALSDAAKRRIEALEPIRNQDLLCVALRETSDARQMIERQGNPPLPFMQGLEEAVSMAVKGALLSPDQLARVAQFAASCRRMEGYLKKGEETRIALSLNGRALLPLEDVEMQIDAAIQGGEVADAASPHLRDIRRKIGVSEEHVKQRLNRLLQSHKDWFADAYVSIRGGRNTLPVKAQHRSHVPGSVIDRSATGGTLFIEPQAVREAQDQLSMLKIDEENEVRRVLYALSAMVAGCEGALGANMSLMTRLDFAFAKAKMSLEMGAREVPIGRDRAVRIAGGRHPLLARDSCVPLDFEVGGDLSGVVITGPNTGGKTVALKTIGLLSLMAQSGLHVPAGEGSRLSMHNQVLVDIGDGQSIAENLSTFSAHMTRVLDILKRATRDSLVLLDELGSGTDPAEGMGLAVAVLMELQKRGCLFVATTHYPEVKQFAEGADGMINARMAFDPDTLQPLYRLILGEAGESCALLIAKRLGFPEALLACARRVAYEGDMALGAPAMESGSAPKLTRYEKPQVAPERARKFRRGDSVRVHPERMMGIVERESDERGMILVHTRAGKRAVPYKRLQLIAPASEMYPEDYDFSIVFDSWEARKADHTMKKRHDPSAVIHHSKP